MTESVLSGGLLSGVTPGRADNVPLSVASGSYIIPADVVSGLGEGNTLSGASLLDKMMNTGPHGMTLRGRRASVQSAPYNNQMGNYLMRRQAYGDLRNEGQYAAGGTPKETTPVSLSHGEYCIPPEQVAALGGGDLERGFKILDAFVVKSRKKNVDKLKNMKPPVGSRYKGGKAE